MFQLDQKADIRNVTISRGKDEEAPVCVLLCLDFDSVGREPVAAALGCREADLDSLFGNKGEYLFGGIEELPSGAKYENKHVIEVLGFNQAVSKISAIKIRPRSKNSYALSCNVQVKDPEERFLETMAANMHDVAQVNLTQVRELPLDQPQAQAA